MPEMHEYGATQSALDMHIVRHTPPEHLIPGIHIVVAGVPQAPMPLHLPVSTIVSFLQVGPEQTTDVSAYLHTPAASQPVLPHLFVAVSLGQVSGSGALVTGLHLPLAPHASQDPQVIFSQQRLSVQNAPATHSEPALHIPPNATFITHMSFSHTSGGVQPRLSVGSQFLHCEPPTHTLPAGHPAFVATVHDVAHVAGGPGRHTNELHGIVLPVPPHEPPEHTVSTLLSPLHVAPQTVPAATRSHWPPEHFPVLPQMLVSEQLSSVWPLATAAHLPALHFSHSPHTFSQHIPSTHAFEAHWSFDIQLTPLALLPPQILVAVSQALPFRQSASVAHGRHAPPSQRLLSHKRAAGVLHAPAPSQKAASLPLFSVVHTAAAHWICAGDFAHLPVPSQEPVFPQGLAASMGQPLSATPAGRFLHVPTKPAVLQLRHAPAHALSQQMPSTQKSPVLHSEVSVQSWPCPALPHLA